MGDMADMMVDLMVSGTLDYDWHDMEGEGEGVGYRRYPPTCKYCGTDGGWHFIEKKGRWQFQVDGKPHTCDAYWASKRGKAVDDFPDDLRVAQAILPSHPAAEQAAQRLICREDGRCQYAIDVGAEGLDHCPEGGCVMPHLAAEQAASQTDRIRSG